MTEMMMTHKSALFRINSITHTYISLLLCMEDNCYAPKLPTLPEVSHSPLSSQDNIC